MPAHLCPALRLVLVVSGGKRRLRPLNRGLTDGDGRLRSAANQVPLNQGAAFRRARLGFNAGQADADPLTSNRWL